VPRGTSHAVAGPKKEVLVSFIAVFGVLSMLGAR
jgi:hypothetical protein